MPVVVVKHRFIDFFITNARVGVVVFAWIMGKLYEWMNECGAAHTCCFSWRMEKFGALER